MSTSGVGDAPPPGLRGRARREWHAQQARTAAAEAFARMDAIQRDLRARHSGAESAAPAGYAELDAQAEALARQYLETVDRHPLGGRRRRRAVLAAAVAYRQLAFRCSVLADRLAALAAGGATD